MGNDGKSSGGAREEKCSDDFMVPLQIFSLCARFGIFTQFFRATNTDAPATCAGIGEDENSLFPSTLRFCFFALLFVLRLNKMADCQG